MKIIKYYKSDRYFIDTEDYDHSKLVVGDKVVCINDSIITLASMAKFGKVYEIKNIDPVGLWMNHWLEPKFKDGYINTTGGVETRYLGTIRFDRTYEYTFETHTQTHTEWLQRFIREDDYLVFMREQKLERIIGEE